MPIIRMAHDKIPADAVNVRIYQDHYRHTTIGRYSDGTIYQNLNPQIPLDEQPAEGFEYTPLLWLYDTHVGLCIKDYERNGYNDSDWYMVVWNTAENKPETIEFASTRGWSYPCYGSSPDATPEVLAAYEAWEKDYAEKMRREREAAEAKLPKVGRTVRVVKGRKLPKGTTGRVFWYGADMYASRYDVNPSPRIGIELETGEKVFTSGGNVEVVQSA